MSDKSERGPFKARMVRGVDPEDVWFYRDDKGNVEVHVDFRELGTSPQVVFVIPRDRSEKAGSAK